MQFCAVLVFTQDFFSVAPLEFYVDLHLGRASQSVFLILYFKIHNENKDH